MHLRQMPSKTFGISSVSGSRAEVENREREETMEAAQAEVVRASFLEALQLLERKAEQVQTLELWTRNDCSLTAIRKLNQNRPSCFQILLLLPASTVVASLLQGQMQPAQSPSWRESPSRKTRTTRMRTRHVSYAFLCVFLPCPGRCLRVP